MMEKNKHNIKKVVTFGEVMMRLSTPGFARFQQAASFNVTYGGGEANVAISLAHFGVPAQHITRFPDNDLGQAATALMRKCGLLTEGILYGGERLGLYFMETGAICRPTKIVYDRANSSFSTIEVGMVDWETVLKDAGWFHFTGISPAISQSAYEVCLEGAMMANKLGITVSGDLNYRKNLWKYGKTAAETMPSLAACCDIAFASRGDMQECLPRAVVPIVDNPKFAEVAQIMMATFPRIKKIINTKRESVSANHNILSAMMYNGKTVLKTQSMEVTPIVDRIGGGDAFCAGMIYGLQAYEDETDALNFALAASVLKHSIEGDANIVSVAEVELVMRGDTSGKLSR